VKSLRRLRSRSRGLEGVGIQKYNSFFSLKSFYFDRVWVKAYPWFFAYLRLGEYRDIYREYRSGGVFEEMTKNFFRLYRTIRCLQIAYRKKVEISDVSECVDILRYGEKEFYDFIRFGDIVLVNGLQLSKEQILDSRLLTYTVVIHDRLHYEKVFYLPLSPWFRVMVKPYLERFTPPMIRVFLNAIEYAKTKVNFDYSDYEYSNANFVDPYKVYFDFESFLEANRSIVDYIKTELPREVSRLWKVFFGREEKLVVKVTQVEVCHDCYVDKLKVLNAVRVLAGRTKTLKYDLPVMQDGFTWSNDVGVKYYVTLKKGLQVKVYSKAVNKIDNKVLNRLEITLRVNKESRDFSISDVFNEEVMNIISDVNMAIGDKSVLEEVRKIISQFIPCVENRELHEIFLLDIFLHGQIRGSTVYRKIAELYKKRGLIEVKARGKYSVYRLKPEYVFIHEKIRELLSGIPTNMIDLPTPPHPTPPEKP
jgi:DNA-binding transcriptional ArsR family regulator